MKINWTWPARAHVIVNERGWYVTFIVAGRRLHFTKDRKALPDQPLW